MKPYYKKCFICGSDNEIGLQLEILSGDDSALCEWTALEKYAGIEGVLHGGIMISICDDMMAHALYKRGVDMMTAHMEMDFKAPVHTGDKLKFEVHVASHREGSKAFHMEGTVMNGDTLAAVFKGVAVTFEGGPVTAQQKQLNQ